MTEPTEQTEQTATAARLQAALNDEQWAAVSAPDGAVLVIAAAGTGKTRTLVYRVAYLVDRGIDPTRILLLTFTNRAAQEMMERARDLVGNAVSGLWGGTFHHMGNRLLRRHADLLGYQTDYTILDQDDARTVVKNCVEELNLKTQHFPKPDVLLSIFSLAANKQAPVAYLASQRFEGTPVDPAAICQVHDAYCTRKQTLNAMDFDDLLVNALTLFRQHEGLLHHYREQFQHILVDEYQDTNTIQSDWVDLLAGPNGNLLVVGDDFQSIYSWRGANYENILSFPDRYPNAHVFKLVTNYRSVPEILGMANACIAGNPRQFQKTLKATRPAACKPVLVQTYNGSDQARFIIQRIHALRREGVPPRDIVILYRSHFHALELQLELTREGMPYMITSGVRFFEQAHIKDVTALLRLLAQPCDELAFQRLLCLWPRLGEKTVRRIWKTLGQRCDLRKPHTREIVASKIPKPAQEGWRVVEAIAAAYDDDQLGDDPAEIIYRFAKGFYNEFAKETFENDDRRIEDINELINYVSKFKSVEDFLNEVALMTNLDGEVGGDPTSDNDDLKIRLSTVHQAKGLEWHTVFILWMTEGMFPSSRSVEEAEDDSEERRLFYVAITRARDELYLCVPGSRRMRDGSITRLAPSRFVRELAPDLMAHTNQTQSYSPY
jgi:DNA helicase II / ATP-dependent DNA helicase PcrA